MSPLNLRDTNKISVIIWVMCMRPVFTVRLILRLHRQEGRGSKPLYRPARVCLRCVCDAFVVSTESAVSEPSSATGGPPWCGLDPQRAPSVHRRGVNARRCIRINFYRTHARARVSRSSISTATAPPVKVTHWTSRRRSVKILICWVAPLSHSLIRRLSVFINTIDSERPTRRPVSMIQSTSPPIRADVDDTKNNTTALLNSLQRYSWRGWRTTCKYSPDVLLSLVLRQLIRKNIYTVRRDAAPSNLTTEHDSSLSS